MGTHQILSFLSECRPLVVWRASRWPLCWRWCSFLEVLEDPFSQVARSRQRSLDDHDVREVLVHRVGPADLKITVLGFWNNVTFFYIGVIKSKWFCASYAKRLAYKLVPLFHPRFASATCVRCLCPLVHYLCPLSLSVAFVHCLCPLWLPVRGIYLDLLLWHSNGNISTKNNNNI